jgi:hypothetical protein
MKKISLVIVFGLLLVSNADAGRGRQPCSGSKGGISHCSGSAFVCNDGSFSQSKKICSGYGSSGGYVQNDRQVLNSGAVKESKKPTKKISHKSSGAKANPLEDEGVMQNQPRKPTCAPLYMATKPGFTNLPICVGNQY